MKICKKFLAFILGFIMMLSMCGIVSAEETTKLLWGTNFNNLTVGAKYDSGKSFTAVEGIYIDSSNTYNQLYLKNGASNKVNTTTIVSDSSDNTNNYIYTSHNQLGYNVNKNPGDFTGFGYSDNLSVYSTSYDIMIPEKTIDGTDNEGYRNRRYASVVFGTTGTTYSNLATCAYANIYDGKISGYATKSTSTTSAKITQKYSKEKDYTYGTWVKLRIDGWIVDSKVRIAVYADNELIYVGERDDVTVTGMAAGATEFRYANIASGTSLASWPAATGNTDNQSYTCYDNFKVSLVNDVVDDSSVPITLHSYPGDSLSAYIGGAGSSIFVDEGALVRSDVLHGSATDNPVKEAFQVVDKSYTNITSSSYKYMVVNSRQSIAKYVQTDAKNTFVYSIDLNFKDFNAQMRNTISLGIEGQATNDVQGMFTVGTDGNISFYHAVTNNGRVVEGKLRNESRAITAGEWINVKMVFEINYGETQYAIKMFGIYEDAVIYENEFTLTHNETTDDKGISIDQISFGIGNDNTEHAETITSIKNIYFEKNNKFNWSAVDTDNWIDRKVSLTLDADGNVDVEAKRGGGIDFTRGVLLVALYDAKGSVIELISEENITDGKFVYEVPAAKVTTAKKIKAFVFDSISTAVPQMKHGEIMIGQ